MDEAGLREGGVYSLPDGRRFVAMPNGTDGYSLYPLRAASRVIRAEYLVGEQGQLLSRGVPTRWRIEDLTESRQTADAVGSRGSVSGGR